MKTALLFVIGLTVPVLAGAKGLARPPAVAHNAAILAGATLSGGRGLATINEASGHGNVQANADAIAQGGAAVASVHQHLTGTVAGLAADSAVIGGQAFARFAGILDINQAAGSNNAEANSMTLARSLRPLSLSALTRIAPPIRAVNHTQVRSGSAGASRSVTVSQEALKGVTGIAQVTQAAGSGNTLSNSVTVNISAGIRP